MTVSAVEPGVAAAGACAPLLNAITLGRRWCGGDMGGDDGLVIPLQLVE